MQGAVQLGVFDMNKAAAEDAASSGDAAKRKDHSKMSIEHRLLAMQVCTPVNMLQHTLSEAQNHSNSPAYGEPILFLQLTQQAGRPHPSDWALHRPHIQSFSHSFWAFADCAEGC